MELLNKYDFYPFCNVIAVWLLYACLHSDWILASSIVHIDRNYGLLNVKVSLVLIEWTL